VSNDGGPASRPRSRGSGPGGRPFGGLRAWLEAVRPKTLPAAVTPVLVGSACAVSVSGFRLGPALACLGVALSIQVGTNLANDVLDFDRGADTGQRVGPRRAVQAGLLSRGQVWAGAVLAFAVSVALGSWLAAVAGWPVFVIGALSIASGVLYTAGPWALAYTGLGDLFVIVFFGFVAVCGTAWVQALQVPPAAWWSALAVGTLAAAILVTNNLRDRKTDALAGKRTLAVRFGSRFTRFEYALMLLLAHAAPLSLVGELGPWPLLSWLALPLAIRVLGRVWRDEGAALNASLAATARLQLLFGVLLALGIVLGAGR